MKKTFLLYLLAAIGIFALASCEDNVDKNNPMIGKWRFDLYQASVETNNDTASLLIKKDIESRNQKKHYIMLYEFMTDNVFVLFNIHNTDKYVGYYTEKGDSLFFEEENRNYWAVKYKKKYFDIYIKDLSEAYTPDSLAKIGVKNPETIVIKKASLNSRYKRV